MASAPCTRATSFSRIARSFSQFSISLSNRFFSFRAKAIYVERILEPCIYNEKVEVRIPLECSQYSVVSAQPLAFGGIVHRLPCTYSRKHQQAHRSHHSKRVLKTRQWTKGTTRQKADHTARHLHVNSVCLRQCDPRSRSRRCYLDTHSSLRMLVRLLREITARKRAPGSSLPSRQSQKSSFTAVHGMVLAPSKQVQVDPLGLYLESKDGWTPWVCDTPAVKMRVFAKERKSSKECMKKKGSKLLIVLGLTTWTRTNVYGCLSISIAA